MLTEKPLTDLLDAFSSSAPTPGGGSASALAGAVGASLLVMVASLPKTRDNSDEDRTALAGARDALVASRDHLARLVDEDTAAYDGVVLAYRLPRATDEEKIARKATIQRAMRIATDVPLGVMRACAVALDVGRTVAARGNPSASSDVKVAVELLMAGLRGARENVDINLGSLGDQAHAEAARAEAVALADAAVRAADGARDALRG